MSAVSEPDAPTVFIVDDEAPVRKALSRLLRAAGFVVAAFASPGEFLAQHDLHKPGCLVLDLMMPGINGMELQRALARKGSVLPIIFLTGHGDIPKSVQAMKSGALDFLTKPVNDENLLASIRAAIKRDSVARREQAELFEIRARLASLTPREQEVLDHVVTGKLNKQIADDLGVVEKTIKVHRARVMTKMKIQSVAELVRLVERSGIRNQ
ncbi:MAG: DNA-binding response regulator [Verrucomicrobia bacterium]|nr:MAG: DNA-binding response regulator [Verrucomicrobiota bacterium]